MRVTHAGVRLIFRAIWRDRFLGVDPDRPPTLVAVTGWRSCVWDTKFGNRERVTFEFQKRG